MGFILSTGGGSSDLEVLVSAWNMGLGNEFFFFSPAPFF